MLYDIEMDECVLVKSNLSTFMSAFPLNENCVVKVNTVPYLEVDVTKCFNAFEIYLDQYMLIYTDNGAWAALEEHEKKYAKQQKRKRQKDLNLNIGASLGNIFVVYSYCFTYFECR